MTRRTKEEVDAELAWARTLPGPTGDFRDRSVKTLAAEVLALREDCESLETQLELLLDAVSEHLYVPDEELTEAIRASLGPKP